MRGCEGAEERPGGVTGAGAEVGALVWVVRRNGSWWPGRIHGIDELPDYCVPPRSDGTPVKLLGRPDGSMSVHALHHFSYFVPYVCRWGKWRHGFLENETDWYNLAKSKLVKPFRCGEFDECIEKAKVQAQTQNIACNEGKYAFREDAIMHALEIERSCFSNQGHLSTYGSCASMKDQISETTNQTTECIKDGIPSTQGLRSSKMKIISFVTPISKGSHKGDDNSLPDQYEGKTECQALDSDAAGLDARVDADVCKPTGPNNNIEVYDIEVAIHGDFMGHGLPLAFLISKSTGKPIKGYPVPVEVLEDSCRAASIDDHRQAISSLDCLMATRISVPRKARSSNASRSKPSGSKKISEYNLDKSWRPHTKKPASSPREMQRFSFYASATRKHVAAKGSPPPVGSTGEPASSPMEMWSFSSSAGSRGESTNLTPAVAKGSLPLIHSQPAAAVKAGSTAEHYVRPTTSFAGSPPWFSSPAASSTRSVNGCTALYLCSASSLCPPVRLV